MNKPRTYTVDNVFNASMVGFDISFKSKKNVNFLIEDISKILVSNVLLSKDINATPNYNPILCMEYYSKLSKYTLKINRGCYSAYKFRITQLITYLNNNCVIDNFSLCKVNLSFDDRAIKSISKIQNMDTFKYILCLDEDYINKFLPKPFESPYNMSSKTLIPQKGVIISPSTMISDRVFKVPNMDYYGVDLSEHTFGMLSFNYIGGQGWTSIPDNIIKIIEYYILYTHQQLNTIGYKNEEVKLYNELKSKFSKTSNILLNPTEFLKTDNSNLSVSINLASEPQVVKTLWGRIYSNIFNLIFCNEVNEGEFNFDTEIDRCQLRTAVIPKGTIVDYDLVDAKIDNCVLVNCRLYDCTVENCRVVNSVAFESCTFINCFLVDCDVEQECLIENSTYVNKNQSVFLGDAKNSVIKYCDISSVCEIDSDTVILNKSSNEALYRDDDTVEDMSIHDTLI